MLLRTTTAPLWASTLSTLALTGEPRRGWRHAGQEFMEEQVAAAQLDWCRAHPAVVEAALRRHRDALEALELL